MKADIETKLGMCWKGAERKLQTGTIRTKCYMSESDGKHIHLANSHGLVV